MRTDHRFSRQENCSHVLDMKNKVLIQHRSRAHACYLEWTCSHIHWLAEYQRVSQCWCICVSMVEESGCLREDRLSMFSFA